MKKILFFVALSFSLLSCKGNQEVEIGNKTTMTVEPVFNAGTVIKGEVISARIKIKNSGSYPLIISDVRPSCSCTVAEKPEEPIAPGEEATILAHVDTDKTSGKMLAKSINIMANTEPFITTVIIKARVEKK